MIADKLDGRTESRRLLHRLTQRVIKSRKPITLATILVGERYDSALYVRLKQQAAAEVGIRTKQIQLPEQVTESRLIATIEKLNQNGYVHGILLQLPLPEHLDTDKIIQLINPAKDVDGFHPENELIVPPPVAAVEHFLDMARPKGKSRVVILGRKSVLTTQLQNRFAGRGWKTEILEHNWASQTSQADIIICVLGRGPRLTGAQVKAGVIVIDVGIRKLKGKTVGDADQSVWAKAKAITPVPGGVGPMTVYYVLHNTYELATRK
jgi:methylenetetrahydrofolate dehydrogenase (NADP+)/methenyltetrahydrofolate cyclohydrolase